MNNPKKYTVTRGNFRAAAEWVHDQYIASRYPPLLEASITPNDDRPPASMPQIDRPISSMKMGHAAFAEARVACRENSILWAVDYCDGIGPRVRIVDLIAEPTDEIEAWDIELS